MPKNICIFSDGTGQGGSADSKTNSNVYRLYLACRGFPAAHQDCFYDPGLGAKGEDGRSWLRYAHDKLSQATGLGITRNIKDCYAAIIQAYEPGDRIFLFGFSRGAYTVRSLGGVLGLCGVPTVRKGQPLRRPGARLTEIDARSPPRPVADAVEEAVEKVYKAYGQSDEDRQRRRSLGAAFASEHASAKAFPHFIGVWDTVRALGMPGLSDLIGFRHAFHDSSLSPSVPHARHALSVDERRKVFHPVLWDTTPHDVASRRIKQVWFPGVHSDVGGSYADDRGLGDLALAWMIEEARAVPEPLLVDVAGIEPPLSPDPLGAQHDETAKRFSLWSVEERDAFHDEPFVAFASLADPHVFERLAAPAVPHPDGVKPYRPPALRRRLPGWRRPGG